MAVVAVKEWANEVKRKPGNISQDTDCDHLHVRILHCWSQWLISGTRLSPQNKEQGRFPGKRNTEVQFYDMLRL